MNCLLCSCYYCHHDAAVLWAFLACTDGSQAFLRPFKTYGHKKQRKIVRGWVASCHYGQSALLLYDYDTHSNMRSLVIMY